MKRLIFEFSIFLLIGISAIAQPLKVQSTTDGSAATYRLVHPLHHMEATSKDVMFRAEIDPTKKEIMSVSAQVDVTTFDSGNSNRDSHAMEVIDAISYPDVSFSGTTITQTGDSLNVAGKLTFHGVTNNVVAVVTPRWSQNRLDVEGGFPLSLTAFKIERPSLLMIPVNDTLRFTLKAAFEWK